MYMDTGFIFLTVAFRYLQTRAVIQFNLVVE